MVFFISTRLEIFLFSTRVEVSMKPKQISAQDEISTRAEFQLVYM